MSIDDIYLNTIDRMEPDIAAVDLTAAAASIAISLKRMADLYQVIAQSVMPIKVDEDGNTG